MAAAGGGIWRSDNALARDPRWTFLSNGFGTNAIGTLVYDAKTNTLYAGTGEPNSSGDSEAGVGIYASHDNGNSWTLLPGSPAAMNARSISSIVIDPINPGTLYVGTTRGVRGVSSVTGGSVSLAPDAAAVGPLEDDRRRPDLQRCLGRPRSARGINHVEMDSQRHDLCGSVPAGDLALDERRLHLGAGLRNPGSDRERRTHGVRPEHDAPADTRGSTSETAAPRPTVQFPPHSNTGVYRADSIDTKTSAQLTNGTTNPGFVSLTDRAAAAPIRRTTTARPSAGTTTSSSRRPGTPTWSTSAAPSTTTCSATASTTAALCCCRRTPATRGPTRQRDNAIADDRDPPRPACAGRSTRRIRCSSSRARTAASSARAAS